MAHFNQAVRKLNGALDQLCLSAIDMDAAALESCERAAKALQPTARSLDDELMSGKLSQFSIKATDAEWQDMIVKSAKKRKILV